MIQMDRVSQLFDGLKDIDQQRNDLLKLMVPTDDDDYVFIFIRKDTWACIAKEDVQKGPEECTGKWFEMSVIRRDTYFYIKVDGHGNLGVEVSEETVKSMVAVLANWLTSEFIVPAKPFNKGLH